VRRLVIQDCASTDRYDRVGRVTVGAHWGPARSFLLEQARVHIEATKFLVEVAAPADPGVTKLEKLLAPETLLLVTLAGQ
jgi:hypothetical protein